MEVASVCWSSEKVSNKNKTRNSGKASPERGGDATRVASERYPPREGKEAQRADE